MKKLMILLLLVCLSVSAQEETVEPQIDLDTGLRSNEADVRYTALKQAAELAKDAPLPHGNTILRGPLYDEDDRVRLMAISLLMYREISDFNEDLVVLLKEANARVRAAAAEALGKLGDKNLVTIPLWKSLADPDEQVRRQAIRSIDLMHGTRLGFYYDQNQDISNYRDKAQEALAEYLNINDSISSSHATPDKD